MSSARKSGVKKVIHRFPKAKVAGSGVDPVGSFTEFMKKDAKPNIDLHRDTVKRQDDLESRKACPALGTTTANKGLPVSRSQIPGALYVSNTDHISFLPSKTDLKSLGTKNCVPRFSKSGETKEGWTPYVHLNTLTNSQSTPYNPITFEPNPVSAVRKAVTVDARRRKGITEFADQQNPFGDRQNASYRAAFEQDPTVFRRRSGIFSHIWDASARQGYITKPFDGPQDFKGAAAFK